MARIMVEKTVCDTPGCDMEARNVCEICGTDRCSAHYVRDERMTGLSGPGIPRFEPLCLSCLIKATGLLKQSLETVDA